MLVGDLAQANKCRIEAFMLVWIIHMWMRVGVCVCECCRCQDSIPTYLFTSFLLFPTPLPQLPLRVLLPLDKGLTFTCKQLFPLNVSSDSISLFSSFHAGKTELLFFVFSENICAIFTCHIIQNIGPEQTTTPQKQFLNAFSLFFSAPYWFKTVVFTHY